MIRRVLFPALLCLLFVANGKAAGPTLVQHAAKDCGTVASCSQAYTTSTVSGNLLLSVVRLGKATPSATLTDTQGDVFNLVGSCSQPADPHIDFVYSARAHGGPTSITVNAVNNSTLRFTLEEFSGVGAFDKFACGVGSGTLAASPSVTTAGADLVIGSVATGNIAGYTANSPFVALDIAGKLETAYFVQSAPGPTASGFTISSDVWSSMVTTFLPAVAAPPPPISVTLNPAGASVAVGRSQMFAAAVANDPSNSGVSWSLTGDGTLSGSTTTSAVYTAPNPLATGSASLVATSIKDGTQSATAGITVVPDNTALSIAFISPGAGTSITGQLNASAQVSDSTSYAVTTVQFAVDGINLGPQFTAGPYIIMLDTANYTAGAHVLSVSVADSGGRSSSATVNVTVVGELFDIFLLYDDTTPYNPGGTVSITEKLPGTPPITQTDLVATILPSGEFKFRWNISLPTVYGVTVADTAGTQLWNTNTDLTPPPVQIPSAFTGVTSTVTFLKSTGAWAGIKLDIAH